MTGALSKYHRHWVQWGGGAGTHACLLNLVGFNKTVLEVGCNTGYLSRVMQQRGCQVTGVEVDEAAARLARPFCRRVIVGDVERLDWKMLLGGELFDVITFGDVLEHLRAPEAVLNQLRDYLAPAGYIVVSLPNIAHGSVRLSLLLGRFDYASLGVLDETHLRFYTRETAQQLLASGGFEISDVWSVAEPISPTLIDQVLSRFPHLGSDQLQEILSQKDAQVFQYVFRAAPVQAPRPVLRSHPAHISLALSVVISHRGAAARLADCLAALAADSTRLRQIVVVSESEPVKEETLFRGEWTWQARQPGDGEAQALNKAIACVDGDVVLLLDSGFILQAGALAALVHHFEVDANAGVAGGQVWNADRRTFLQAGAYLSPPVALIAYRGAEYPVGDERWNTAAEVDFVPMAFMAFRRSLWQDLGGFDERYRAHYLDADFCARVWAAGYRVSVEPQALAIAAFTPENTLDRLADLHRDRLRFVRRRYGQAAWPGDFFEAEQALLDETRPGPERQALRLAYLEHLAHEDSEEGAGRQSLLDLCRRVERLEAKTWPHVSLILVNWNGRPFLPACLSSLLQSDYPDFDVLVVDNASSDDSVQFVRQTFPQVEVYESGQNLGYGAGGNIGLRRAAGRLAVVLNADLVVSPDWLRRLILPMLEDETIGIAGCKMYYPGGRRLQHAGGYITYPQALPGHYGLNEQDNGQCDERRDVDYVIGAALAVRRETLDRIGLFDEGFFMYFEDVDLCARARRAGYRVVYVPDATLIHVESAVANKGSLAYFRHIHTSRWRFLLKHYDMQAVVRDTLPAERAYVARCAPDERAALAHAYRATLDNLPAIWIARVRDGGAPVTQEQAARIAQELEALHEAAQALPASPEQPPPSAAPPAPEPAAPAAAMPADLARLLDELRNLWQVREHPFVSNVPVLGPLIVRFRQAWNSVSTRWYVSPLIEQQSQVNWRLMEANRLLAEELARTRQELAQARQNAHQDAAHVRQEAHLEIEQARQEAHQKVEQARRETAQVQQGLLMAQETSAALDHDLADTRRLLAQALYRLHEEDKP